MDEIIQINSQLQTNINLPCTTFALLGHYAATIKNGRVMHKNAIFAKEISDSRRNCGGENGTLLVNEFFIGTVNRQKVTSIDNHKHVPSTD